MDIVKSIVRRATRGEKLNIIVVGATHERYESELAKTGHEFFCLNDNIKQWDINYAPIPENYHIINQIPYHEEFDLILLHTSGDRYNLAKQIQGYCDIPIIKHCHVLPQTNEEITEFNKQPVQLNTFISDFSKKAWACSGDTIVHGLDTEFWTPGNEVRENHLLSVVNYWAQRDWACGWNLWKSIVSDTKMPVCVVGNNPNISKPAKNVTELRNTYQKSRIFLNTSLHSPIPMALLEAMACGCAIVSTATCMIPEIIEHGENGLIANDPHELREYCKILLAYPERAKNLGDKARQTIEAKYNIENFKNSWNSTFNKVLYK